MDRIERHDWQATRDHLKAILGIEGDSGLTNAEMAGRVWSIVERLKAQTAQYRRLEEENASLRARLADVSAMFDLDDDTTEEGA